MLQATFTIVDEQVTASTVVNTEVVLAITQGASLWETEDATHIKPKGGNTVKAEHIDLSGIVQTPSGDGDKAFFDNDEYYRVNKCTGFIGDINRYYDYTTRKYSFTGDFKAYHNGVLVTALIDGWESSPHADVSGTYYLYYDGTFHFDTAQFDIETDLLIGYCYYNSSKFGMSECHGLDMSGSTHRELHFTMGTYKSSGGDFTDYALNSTTGINRRPLISSTTIYDEDLKTVLPQMTSELYTQRRLTGANTREFFVSQGDILPVTGAQPYYNLFTGGAWTQAVIPTNNYAAVFVAALPVTDDTNSQQFRYVFVQPQTVNSSLSVIQALTPSSLNLGDPSALVAEYCFIGKIIIRYIGGDWQLTSVDKLEGTKIQQVAIAASPVSASGVAYTPTGDIEGTDVQAALTELDTEKQAALVSGTNIKTVNSNSLLGSGNVVIPTTRGISFYVDGALTVDTKLCSIIAPFAMTITEIRVAVDVAPTGANLIVDVNKNGTTLYTTQANRPTITATNTSATATDPDVTAIAVGDIISVDVDQIGSTVAGENLMVIIICEV